MSGVKDRVALVTGAGSPDGIGFATARLLYSAGAKIAITSTTDRINERRDEIERSNVDVFSRAADLTDSTAVTTLIEQIENDVGPIEIVINNAGMVQIGRDETSTLLQDVSDEQWHYGIDINLTSAFMVTRAVLPGMMERNYGRIVNISSVTGPSVGIAGSSVYSAAKAGMLGMTRSLAIESGPNNVTVNCIGPGWIETTSLGDNEIAAGKFTPIGRAGTPEEVGHVALFLASEEASYVTGQLLIVDGGNTIQEYKVAF